jgi:hypothetical protein
MTPKGSGCGDGGAAKSATVILLVGAMIAMTGCSGLGAPAAPSGTTAGVARAQTTHEYPTPARRQTAANAAPSATEAIRSFARAYINWNAQTVAADMRALAGRSVGQARSAMALAADQTANDYELRRGGIANRGSVQAVAALTGSSNRYVVVTRETTTATATDAYPGLRPAWHLTIATVTAMPGGRWAVSGWQPET